MNSIQLTATCFVLAFASVRAENAPDEARREMEVTRQLYHTTARLETYLERDQPKKTGTGFFISESYEGNKVRTFLVTCAHVVYGMTALTFTLPGMNANGSPDYSQKIKVNIDDLPTHAFLHPNSAIDVAVINVTAALNSLEKSKTPAFHVAFTFVVSLSAAKTEWTALQNLIFIGYPRGIIDTKNLTPLARRGTTATPMDQDFNGQPFFMIDAAVFHGSSGSPVFAYDAGAIPKGSGVSFGHRAVFVGMISDAYFAKENGEVKYVSQPTADSKKGVYTDSYGLNLGLVIKEKVIFDLIDLFNKIHKSPAPLRKPLT